MKVLHVVPGLSLRTGGPPAQIVDSALALREYGIETTVFSTDLPGPAGAAHSGETAELPPGADRLPVCLFPARPPYRLAYSPALGRALAAAVPEHDVVHIHSLFLFPQFAAYRAARAARVPYIVSQHGALDAYMRRRGRLRKWAFDVLWQRRMLERATALHVMSEGEAATIADVAPGVPRVVVPFGLDLGQYDSAPPAAEFRKRYLGNGDAPLVVNVGRLAEKKGLDVLVRAFGHVVRRVPDARLALVGPDDENLMGPLQGIAEAEGVASQVVFTGLLTGRDKLAALAAADVWALPSRSEAFPMAVLEALAMGCPAVITPAVNNAADVEAAGAALVVEPEPAPFGGALAELLADPERRAALRGRARAFVEDFDLPKVAPQWAAAYARVSGRG